MIWDWLPIIVGLLASWAAVLVIFVTFVLWKAWRRIK